MTCRLNPANWETDGIAAAQPDAVAELFVYNPMKADLKKVPGDGILLRNKNIITLDFMSARVCRVFAADNAAA